MSFQEFEFNPPPLIVENKKDLFNSFDHAGPLYNVTILLESLF
jgi:hypothetical protein